MRIRGQTRGAERKEKFRRPFQRPQVSKGRCPIDGNLSEKTFGKRKSVKIRDREIGQVKNPKLNTGNEERKGDPKGNDPVFIAIARAAKLVEIEKGFHALEVQFNLPT